MLNHFFQRLGLEEILRQYLPDDDVRQELPSERIVLLLVRNAPELFDLFHADIPLLHDDRLAKCLARLYTATTPDMILAVVGQAVRAFRVALDELHNDSTSVARPPEEPTQLFDALNETQTRLLGLLGVDTALYGR